MQQPTNLMSGLNNIFAQRIADALATMSMFYAVLFFVTFPLMWQRPDGAVQWIMYLSSTFFQAVALPVLALVAKHEGNKQAKLQKETHDAVMAELRLLRSIYGNGE